MGFDALDAKTEWRSSKPRSTRQRSFHLMMQRRASPDWIRRVCRAWVQRCKRLRIERRRTGIRIELETQDDLGYYEYGFDVFPKRGTKSKGASSSTPS